MAGLARMTYRLCIVGGAPRFHFQIGQTLPVLCGSLWICFFRENLNWKLTILTSNYRGFASLFPSSNAVPTYQVGVGAKVAAPLQAG